MTFFCLTLRVSLSILRPYNRRSRLVLLLSPYCKRMCTCMTLLHVLQRMMIHAACAEDRDTRRREGLRRHHMHSGRNPMKRVPPLFRPSLTGGVLVALLVFGCPAVSGALAEPGADGPRRAIAGTPPAALPGAPRYGVLVRQALAGATAPGGHAMIGLHSLRRIGRRPSARRRSSRTWPMRMWCKS
jgi:hypothetical protein